MPSPNWTLHATLCLKPKLLVWWRWRKINEGMHVFSFRPTKKFSLQNREKTEGKNWTSFLDKNAHVQLHMGLSTLLFIFFPLFFFFFFPPRCCLFFIFFLLLLFIYWASFLHVPCSYSFFFFFSFAFFCVFLFRCDFFFF